MFNSVYKPEDVATKLLAAIERGRFENYPGFDIWLQRFVTSRLPGLARYIADSEWRTAVKKAEAEGDATTET